MSGYNFTARLRTVCRLAREEAARLKQDYVGPEHLLLGIIREGNGVAAAILISHHIDLDGLRQQIEATLKPGKPMQAGAQLPYTSSAKKVLEGAMMEARDLDHAFVGTQHLLLGVLRETRFLGFMRRPKHGVAWLLADAGLTAEQVRGELGSGEPRETGHQAWQ